MTARAVICRKFGPASDLTIEDIESPPLEAQQVRIDVKACGVNFPDNLIIKGLYQFKPDFPFSPGSEAAGVVTEVGAGQTRFKVGDHVLWFGLFGAFREELVVNSDEVVAMPSGMNFLDAAAFLMTYGTSLHGLKDRAHIAEGETLLVLGAGGGVGIAAVELGKALGARVIAAASTDAKLAAAREHGASETINYQTEDLRQRVRELTDSKGVDVLYDPVGGELAQAALRSMAIGGRYLVVGFASGEIPQFRSNLVLLKECQIVGVFYGAFIRRQPDDAAANLAQLFDLYQSGVLMPRIHATQKIDDVALALEEISERRTIGKTVLDLTRDSPQIAPVD